MNGEVEKKSAFQGLNSYDPVWGRHLDECDYYVGANMGERTKRLIDRPAKKMRQVPLGRF